MVKRNKENKIIARLIKCYLLFTPSATANEISRFLATNNLGLNSPPTPHEVGGIIKSFRNDPVRAWFNIEKVSGEPTQYMVDLK